MYLSLSGLRKKVWFPKTISFLEFIDPDPSPRRYPLPPVLGRREGASVNCILPTHCAGRKEGPRRVLVGGRI